MINVIRGKNLTATQMHDKMCEKLMFGDELGRDYDFVYGTDVGLHNVAIMCDSFEWDFDLKRLWMPRSRWNMMVRQYLEPSAVDDWKEKIGDRLVGRGRGIAVLRTQNVQGRGSGRNVRRRWGSCMLSFSYRSNPIPTVTMHSRTTYFGYLAAMDITVAHVLARTAGEITGIDPSEMQFVWNIELAQFHGFRSLAWPLGQEDILGQMEEDVYDRTSFSLKGPKAQPGYRKCLDGFWRLMKSDDEGKLYGDESFSSFCRVRRRYHAEIRPDLIKQFEGGDLRGKGVNGFAPLPSVPAHTLDLSPIYR